MPQRRYEITDFEWSIIKPLSPNKPRGVPRVDDRKVLNGIFWRLRTGSPWADIPERYGRIVLKNSAVSLFGLSGEGLFCRCLSSRLRQ